MGNTRLRRERMRAMGPVSSGPGHSGKEFPKNRRRRWREVKEDPSSANPRMVEPTLLNISFGQNQFEEREKEERKGKERERDLYIG